MGQVMARSTVPWRSGLILGTRPSSPIPAVRPPPTPLRILEMEWPDLLPKLLGQARQVPTLGHRIIVRDQHIVPWVEQGEGEDETVVRPQTLIQPMEVQCETVVTVRVVDGPHRDLSILQQPTELDACTIMRFAH